MEKYIGKSVYKGTAIGPINVLKMILSILVDTFSSRILNPMLLPSGKRNIVVF